MRGAEVRVDRYCPPGTPEQYGADGSIYYIKDNRVTRLFQTYFFFTSYALLSPTRSPPATTASRSEEHELPRRRYASRSSAIEKRTDSVREGSLMDGCCEICGGLRCTFSQSSLSGAPGVSSMELTPAFYHEVSFGRDYRV